MEIRPPPHSPRRAPSRAFMRLHARWDGAVMRGRMTSKSQLRKRVRGLTAFEAGLAAVKSEAICDHVLALPEWKNARTVALFSQHQNEPDLHGLFLNAGGRSLCFPLVDGDILEFHRVLDPEEGFETGPWNLRQPVAGPGTAVNIDEIDLLLVPGMAFTPDGARLGRGGGFYDRLLADPQLRATRIGICFQVQIVGELPTESHDMPVDLVITEEGPATSGHHCKED